MPQAHAGVEMGDPKAAAVERGPRECTGDVAGHPHGARENSVQHLLDHAQPLQVGSKYCLRLDGRRIKYVQGTLPTSLGPLNQKTGAPLAIGDQPQKQLAKAEPGKVGRPCSQHTCRACGWFSPLWCGVCARLCPRGDARTCTEL